MWGINLIWLPTAWVTESDLMLGCLYVIPPTFVLNISVKAAVGTVLALSSVTAMAGVVEHWRSGK
jgi:uncharacterized membrane protein YfcA